MKKKGFFTGFYLNIDKQARAMYHGLCVDKNYQYVYDNPVVESVEYRRKAVELLHKLKESNDSSISIKEYLTKDYRYWQDEMEYVNMAFNIFLSDELGLSQEQIKEFFKTRNLPEISRAYNQYFRSFFIKQKLLTMGDVLSREQLENRIKRTNLNLEKLRSSGKILPEYRVECENNIQAYQTALKYMNFAKIDEVDLFALFNAQSLTAYVPKGNNLNPRELVEEIYAIDKSFALGDDVVTRDNI